MTLRLPVHLIVAVHRRAELEGVPVTRWIEIAIERSLHGRTAKAAR